MEVLKMRAFAGTLLMLQGKKGKKIAKEIMQANPVPIDKLNEEAREYEEKVLKRRALSNRK